MSYLLLFTAFTLGSLVGVAVLGWCLYSAFATPEALGQILGKWFRIWSEKTKTDSLYVYDTDQRVTRVRIDTLIAAVEHEVPRSIHLLRTRNEQHPH